MLELREAIAQAAQEWFALQNGGTYVCTEGPRFGLQQIDMFKQLGRPVGMTSVPEVCLARELGICYANISIITNYAAGILHHTTHSEVYKG